VISIFIFSRANEVTAPKSNTRARKSSIWSVDSNAFVIF